MTKRCAPLKAETIIVDLQDRSYPIHIGKGLLEAAYTLMKPHLAGKKIAVITDENIAPLYLDTLIKALGGKGFVLVPIVLPAGEEVKSFEYLQNILAKLLAENFSRADTLIALGGGVIGDLTGFAASQLKRGCRFIQIPTTLLAQVDSSVGGKTAINMPMGKNLVGSFYQPKLVLTDLNVLQTLPMRELKAGYAEVLKYALIDNIEFFHWLEKHGHEVLAHDEHALQSAISHACKAKAAIVKSDEREHGQRALLNLGHSFAHAIEGLAGYDGRVLHGEAVSAGLLMAFEFSQRLGLCDPSDVQSLQDHLVTLGMPTLADLPKCVYANSDSFFEFMLRDKKNTDEDLNLILAHGIGQAFVAKHTDKVAVKTYLTNLCNDTNHPGQN